jgi:hypothetical protein
MKFFNEIDQDKEIEDRISMLKDWDLIIFQYPNTWEYECRKINWRIYIPFSNSSYTLLKEICRDMARSRITSEHHMFEKFRYIRKEDSELYLAYKRNIWEYQIYMNVKMEELYK